MSFLSQEGKKSGIKYQLPSVGARPISSLGIISRKCCLTHKSAPADPRHRNIYNIVVQNREIFSGTPFSQRLISIDATTIGSTPPVSRDQDHAVFLRVVGKSTAFKNRLHRGHSPLNSTIPGALTWPAYIHSSWVQIG